MIKDIENLKYNFKKQEEEYPRIAKKLKVKDKYDLIEEIFEKDFWSYFQIFVEILFDIASEDEVYIKILSKAYSKLKNDMGAFPFFHMLIRLGKEKEEGIKIYKKIISQAEDEDLKASSGLILGGYSIKNSHELKTLIKRDGRSYPETNIILKAILVKSEELKEISKQEYDFLDFVSQSDDERILMELMNLCIFLFGINKKYFKKMLNVLMSKKKSSVNAMIWIRKDKMDLSNKEIFELAELTKDCNEYAIDEMIRSLILNKSKYTSKEIGKISDLLIYWINKDLKFKVRDLDWALEELSKKYPETLDYFLDNYKKLKIKEKKLNYSYLFPRIFERLIRNRIKESITKLLEKNILKKDFRLFLKLSMKIIGEIYDVQDKEEGFNNFLPLAKIIQNISEREEFINENKKLFKEIIKKKNFEVLIDYSNDLLEQFIFRIRDFNFKKIYANLSKFEKINQIIVPKLKEIEKSKRYSPFFWIGSWQRDKELKKAYLEEIENFIIKSENIPNEKTGNNNTWSLLANLGDEEGFWNHFSEIIFSNKFVPEYNSVLEPLIPNKENNSDLLIELNDKKMFFEVTKPKTNRNLHLDNGAVGIKNKLNKAIHVKAKQFRDDKTLKEMKEGKRKDLFFIVVDRSFSTIDEYMIEDSFYGSLAIQFYRNNETGETTPSRTIRQDNAVIKNKEFIAGLIYFKQQWREIGGKIKPVLVGDIIQNPEAINQITPEDYKKLKKIIFR